MGSITLDVWHHLALVASADTEAKTLDLAMVLHAEHGLDQFGVRDDEAEPHARKGEGLAEGSDDDEVFVFLE